MTHMLRDSFTTKDLFIDMYMKKQMNNQEDIAWERWNIREWNKREDNDWPPPLDSIPITKEKLRSIILSDDDMDYLDTENNREDYEDTDENKYDHESSMTSSNHLSEAFKPSTYYPSLSLHFSPKADGENEENLEEFIPDLIPPVCLESPKSAMRG